MKNIIAKHNQTSTRNNTREYHNRKLTNLYELLQFYALFTQYLWNRISLIHDVFIIATLNIQENFRNYF